MHSFFVTVRRCRIPLMKTVRRAKLARLRPHMDFATALSDMIRKDNADALKYLIDPLLKLNIRKTLDLKTIDEALMVKPERYEKEKSM